MTIRWTLGLLACAWVIIAPACWGQDRLTAEDRHKLTQYLEAISRHWDQPSVDAANAILSRPAYGEREWTPFFGAYFASHPFTDELRNYLGYPVFSWFDSRVHEGLQKGLFPVIKARLEKLPVGNLARDRNLRDSLFNGHRFLQIYLSHQHPFVAKREIARFYQHYAACHTDLFRDDRRIDTHGQPFLGSLRAQVVNNLVESLEGEKGAGERVSRLVGLRGGKLRLWNEFGIVVLDNGHFDNRQVEVLLTYFRSLPPGIPKPQLLTQNDALGNAGPHTITLMSSNSVNIFGLRVGERDENEFPEDVAPRKTDMFLACLSHEANHVVNAKLIETNPRLAARQKALISAAGNKAIQYLRSMIPGDTFPKAPQEFFASMANQWFCDSEYTLELGLRRFSRGNKQPLNQALFFGEVYSQGGDRTWFYQADTQGKLTARAVPLTRDRNGHIDSLRVPLPRGKCREASRGAAAPQGFSHSAPRWGATGGDGVTRVGSQTYRFSLDASGNVLSYRKT